MLATLQSVLRRAQKGKYAVGAFNVANLEQTQAVIAAAVAERSPVIVNTSEKAIDYAGAEELAALVTAMAKKHRLPIVLNLDHGRHRRTASQCMRLGWTGIMFDGSTLPYERNITQTAAVKREARRFGIGVEGEIGQVNYRHGRGKAPKVVLASPAEAQDFVRRTKVDALAVGIGNSHGLPIPGERLHFDLLAQLRAAVRVPLVLHGASGTPAPSIRRAIHLGICKINIDTDLRLAFTSTLRQTIRDTSLYDPRDLLMPSRQAEMETVRAKMILFGSRRKA